MFNAVKRFWKRSVPVTLKRPDGSGMTYRELVDLLGNLRRADLASTKITMSAADLYLLIGAARAVREAEIEDASVKNGLGDAPFISGMSDDYDECGMGSVIYVCPAYGLDFTYAYRLDR